jgi:outer membrane protein OmpA-like peptidoglycan-associated protein
MRASEFNEFDDLEYEALLEGSKERSWIWFGLIVSLCIHLSLCIYFYRTRFQAGGVNLSEAPQPPTFKVKSVDLTQMEKSSADQVAPAAKPEPDNSAQQPDEKKSFDKLLQEVQATTAMPDDMSNVLPDKPKVEQADVSSFMKDIEPTASQTLSNDPNSPHEQSALNQSAVSGRPQPALSGTELATSTIVKRPSTVTSQIPRDSAGPNKKGAPGTIDLEQALSQIGPLGAGTKIGMPSDQLFAFDSADFQPSASGELGKLITLMKRLPKATFTIAGYTDSIGTEEYNLDLSQRRAESVKQYLVQTFGMDPNRIRTRGYGKANPIKSGRDLPPTASQAEFDAEIARQQPNRRVVITIDTNPQ